MSDPGLIMQQKPSGDTYRGGKEYRLSSVDQTLRVPCTWSRSPAFARPTMKLDLSAFCHPRGSHDVQGLGSAH